MTDKKKTTSPNPEEDGTQQERYNYLSADRQAVVPGTRDFGGPPSSVLNSAVYPAYVKPEELHTEAEKAGAAFPLGDPEAEDLSVKGEDLDALHREQNKGLYEQYGSLPGQVVKVEDTPALPVTSTGGSSTGTSSTSSTSSASSTGTQTEQQKS